jgi:hypothetical protein
VLDVIAHRTIKFSASAAGPVVPAAFARHGSRDDAPREEVNS